VKLKRLSASKYDYILWLKPKRCYFSWAIEYEWLSDSNEKGCKNGKVKALIDENIAKCACEVEAATDDETYS
jgi:hypothetical protein